MTLPEDPEERMKQFRACLSGRMRTEWGRGRSLSSLTEVGRECLRRGDAPQSLSGWVAVVSAIESRCTGDEKYDPVALTCVMSDIRMMVGDTKPLPEHRELADWLRTATGGQLWDTWRGVEPVHGQREDRSPSRPASPEVHG